jgi:hypothetical protein
MEGSIFGWKGVSSSSDGREYLRMEGSILKFGWNGVSSGGRDSEGYGDERHIDLLGIRK